MRTVKNESIPTTIRGDLQIGDRVIAIANGSDIDRHGRSNGIWDYRVGDIGVVVNYVENMGYYVQTERKVYNGVYRHSWKKLNAEV